MVPQAMSAELQVTRTRIEAEMVALYPDLHARAFALTKDPDAAADLVQQACERGLRAKSSIEKGTNTAAWLKCVIRNSFVDEYRCRRKYAPLLCDPEAETRESQAPAFADLLTIDDVKQGILALREADRVILELALLENRSYRDISRRLGIPPKTVGTRLFRAKAKLRKELQVCYEQRLANFIPTL
jgi:RNA polymerase sigma-70 factor, ECF subfamily